VRLKDPVAKAGQAMIWYKGFITPANIARIEFRWRKERRRAARPNGHQSKAFIVYGLIL